MIITKKHFFKMIYINRTEHTYLVETNMLSPYVDELNPFYLIYIVIQ